MARSRHIYAVTIPGASVPLSCFTTKTDLALWLLQRTKVERDSMRVLRYFDGGRPATITEMSVESILEGV